MLEIHGDAVRVIWDRRSFNAGAVSVSGDGKLVAVGSYSGGTGVAIWEADTGRLIHELPIGDARVVFSADGRRIYTTTVRLSPNGAECRSWRVPSWEPDHSLQLMHISHSPPVLSVAADGSVAVVFAEPDRL